MELNKLKVYTALQLLAAPLLAGETACAIVLILV